VVFLFLIKDFGFIFDHTVGKKSKMRWQLLVCFLVLVACFGETEGLDLPTMIKLCATAIMPWYPLLACEKSVAAPCQQIDTKPADTKRLDNVASPALDHEVRKNTFVRTLAPTAWTGIAALPAHWGVRKFGSSLKSAGRSLGQSIEKDFRDVAFGLVSIAVGLVSIAIVLSMN
jgi:hypothetical protein